jgi:hypothetical protein
VIRPHLRLLKRVPRPYPTRECMWLTYTMSEAFEEQTLRLYYDKTDRRHRLASEESIQESEDHTYIVAARGSADHV